VPLCEACRPSLKHPNVNMVSWLHQPRSRRPLNHTNPYCTPTFCSTRQLNLRCWSDLLILSTLPITPDCTGQVYSSHRQDVGAIPVQTTSGCLQLLQLLYKPTKCPSTLASPHAANRLALASTSLTFIATTTSTIICVALCKQAVLHPLLA
jgi:hypothetical protein